jgi:hypothetical protein
MRATGAARWGFGELDLPVVASPAGDAFIGLPAPGMQMRALRTVIVEEVERPVHFTSPRC